MTIRKIYREKYIVEIREALCYNNFIRKCIGDSYGNRNKVRSISRN